MKTIFKKQVLDTFKNKTILIQLIMFPVMAFIMTNSITIPNMPKNYFVLMFASMYIGMAPIISMSTIIAEEKETRTLRVLLMSNVKAYEYLLGVGSYMWSVCMIGSIAFALIGGYRGIEFLLFIVVMAIGIIISIIIGAMIGTLSESQMMSTSITIPVMMFFTFVPMLSMFNKSIERFGSIVYTQQMYQLISNMNQFTITKQNVVVCLVTIAIAGILFALAYRKKGLQ